MLTINVDAYACGPLLARLIESVRCSVNDGHSAYWADDEPGVRRPTDEALRMAIIRRALERYEDLQDASEDDIVFQYATLGEVRYG